MTEDKKNYITFLKKIASPDWKIKNRYFYFIILLCFAIIAYYNLSIGFHMSSDSVRYSLSADILIKLNFNLFDYYSQKTISDINSSYIYTIPVLLISLSKFFFGIEWQNAFMTLNLTLVFFSLIIFLKTFLILKIRPLIIFLAIPILVFSVDILTWPRYILTDTVFSFFIFLGVYYLIKSIVNQKFYYFFIILLMVLIYLTRPTSLPFIFGFIIFYIILTFKINYSPRLILLIIFSLFIVTPFIFATLYELMNTYLNTSPKVLFLIKMVDIGMIIHDRPETWIHSPNSFLEIVYLYFKRILFFFTPYAKSFSTIHIILNSLQTFYIILSVVIWSFWSKNFEVFNKVIFLILLLSFFVSAFHAYTLIDYDWRYRFPIIMPLSIIFPISMEIFLRKFSL